MLELYIVFFETCGLWGKSVSMVWCVDRCVPSLITPKLGDFIFWLNEVPCVSITFVGVVVGINSYDDNTLIWGQLSTTQPPCVGTHSTTVDDGSAVVKAKLPHIRIPHVQETKSKEGKSIKKEEIKIYGPPNGLPCVGNTVKVFAKLENGWQNQEQPVNIRIKDFC